jgi:phenylacetic acid degradation operon negative regulatory protein
VSTPPNPRHLILNLLLAAGAPLPVRNAVAACALFGIRGNSVRVTMVRLVAEGFVVTAGRGEYRLGPNAKTLAADVATWRSAEKRMRKWNGDWVVVHVGNLGRSDRAALRARDRALALLGLRELDRGLYVRPDNLVGGVTAVRERLHTLGLDDEAGVFVAQGFDSDREARARSLWAGEELDRGYRQQQKILDAWLMKAEDLGQDAAARESFLLGNAAIRTLVFDPLLPAPLVDAEARRAFIDSLKRFDDAGRAIWKSLDLTPEAQSILEGSPHVLTD